MLEYKCMVGDLFGFSWSKDAYLQLNAFNKKLSWRGQTEIGTVFETMALWIGASFLV